MNATETAVNGLTALDIKALRTADRVSFHHLHGDPHGSIVATKRVNNAGPFEDRERDHRMTCCVTFSGRFEDSRVDRHNCDCFAMVYAYSEVWQTIAAFLRTGDEILLEWYADGQCNGYCEKAIVQDGPGAGMRLHADVLYLKVMRKGKRYSFYLDASICPNNTARMIRPR